MKTYKVPARKCVCCGEQKDKKELVRVVKTPEGNITIDMTGKANGRGAYLCKNISCVEAAKKKHRIEGALKTQIPQEIYAELERIISE